MMNKLGILFCLLSGLGVSSLVKAEWQTNALLGISGGFGWQNGEYNLNLWYVNTPLPTTYNLDSLRGTGSTWGVLAGYQATCEGWLLGAELNLDWYDVSHQRSFLFQDNLNLLVWDTQASYQHRPTIGISGRLGYAMAPYFVAYMRLGLETSLDKLSTHLENDLLGLEIGLENKGRAYRVITGVGAETPLAFLNLEMLSVRLEYNFHLPYKALSEEGVILDGLIVAFSNHAKPRTQVIKASLVWNVA